VLLDHSIMPPSQGDLEKAMERWEGVLQLSVHGTAQYACIAQDYELKVQTLSNCVNSATLPQNIAPPHLQALTPTEEAIFRDSPSC
jgi:hypothetical protein